MKIKLAFIISRKVTKADFQKKYPGPKMGKIGPKWPKSGVFGHFLDFKSLDFSDFVYYNRQQWYLAGTGGLVRRCDLIYFELIYSPSLQPEY